MMTAEEFERWYAGNSNVTVAFLHYWGRRAERCYCGEPDCTGWIMGFPWEDALFDEQRRQLERR